MFENKNKSYLKQQLEELPSQMENPYQILKRFIRWEIMDLESIIECIESKNELQKRLNSLNAQRKSDSKQLFKLQNGGSYFIT